MQIKHPGCGTTQKSGHIIIQLTTSGSNQKACTSSEDDKVNSA